MRRLFCALIVAGLWSVPGLYADNVALNFTGGTSYYYVTNPLPNTIGWQFTLSAPVSVTSLGFYQTVGNVDIVAPHDVGIWDASGNEVASGTVTPTDPDIQGFLWDAISPVTLPAGTYQIGALVDNDDPYYANAASISSVPGVTYDGGVYLLGAFGNPTSVGYEPDGRFGPDFMISSVPEPGAMTLLLLGLGGLGFLRRRVVEPR